MKKGQSLRLTAQHKKAQGVVGIFGEVARLHDASVSSIQQKTLDALRIEYPNLNFRYRNSISKSEINSKLQDVNADFGNTLYVPNASIKPDGGVIEVEDKKGQWRIVLVSEAKHQGKDIENIKKGVLVGSNNDQDLMAAGNAIERSHKNIAELSNMMLGELHFPYCLFLTGSNFLTETIEVERPDGRVVTLEHNSGTLNRLDRLTAANYGLPINQNHCINKVINNGQHSIMLQAASIYTQGNGDSWKPEDMMEIMYDIARTSLNVMVKELDI
ncbi:MAG: EcoRI family type II restriction endonuclease [Vibrio diabolicus]